MLLTNLLATLAVFASAVTAAVATPHHRRDSSKKCKPDKPKNQRKAWHTLSNKEKKAYIDAELCLMSKPATLGLPGATNRFEELQSIHQASGAIIHNVGGFLPYHRYYLYAHEKLLQDECGYKGMQPWWDETRDAGHYSTSVVLDPVTGFGGDGSGPNGCITTGPFASFVNNIGPGYWFGPNCINRYVNDSVSVMAGQAYIDFCRQKQTFAEFWPCFERCPHRSGHGAIGGKLLDAVASPGDPLFYLHHAWLDKLWWEWQELNLGVRLTEIGGVNVSPPRGTPPPPGSVSPNAPEVAPAPSAFPPSDSLNPDLASPYQKPAGDPGNITTLNHVLNMGGIIPNATIAGVMDIRGSGLLCYEYA
ncbi:hypothetical protein B0T14DRAFT_484352 [Immersiella caudata]|uniref:Tyrosinase copper-binding domain-containing protein n=1 Tax=Immersiella caudata TaxID=314043 RepID=A0AA39WL81_9PEZI|nr:hypothetical protein B0T14DRAFT_484352 [Immersiella caudata]